MLLLASCGSDSPAATAVDVATPTEVAPTAEPPATTPPTPTVEPEATSADPTATPETTQVPDATATPQATQGPAATPIATSVPNLPGSDWDLFVPDTGETVAVVGVAYDDILEVHAEPGENTPLVGTFEPVADDIVSLGEGRMLSVSVWWRVNRGEVTGWVGSRFMSRLGFTDDITSQVVDSIGEIPAAETMLDLGMLVAEQRASIDPPSSVVVSVAPTVGDLGEITIDVVGLGDDAVEGERLHVFGQPLESGEGFSLAAVEATIMCSRGVTADGFCI